MTSTDVGVMEPSNTPIGFSLQLAGTGAQRSDFIWQPPASETPGAPNTGQVFDGCFTCKSPEDCDDGLVCTIDDCVAEKCVNDLIECPVGLACNPDNGKCEASCPADLNGDGVVGPVDLATLLGSWGPCEDCVADIDGSGDVGPVDLAMLLGSWGPCE